jgi:hypothetical protein
MANDILPIFGAITGGLGCLFGGTALYLNWRSYRRDRPNLHVQAALSIAHTKEIPKIHYQLKVTITNRGRRVIQIRKIYIQRLDVLSDEDSKSGLSRWTTFAFNMPKGNVSLGELDQRIWTNPLRDDFVESLGNFGVVFVEDTGGKTYTAIFPIPDKSTMQEIRRTGKPVY